ncbi:MAG TPA: hypothetical protein VLJ61_06575 [Pyrinomonadaceae bacterium]|nr:hypothetical protein [Pyrinomonadaceae bacterium]
MPKSFAAAAREVNCGGSGAGASGLQSPTPDSVHPPFYFQVAERGDRVFQKL